MGQAKQGGSILGYVLVGGVLVLLLVGGAYALRNIWSGTPATEVAQEANDAPAETKPEEEKPAEPSRDPAPAQPPAAEPAPQSPAPEVTQLPATGPADTLLSVSILVILVACVMLYVQSRRFAASL